MAAPSDNWIKTASTNSLHRTGEGVDRVIVPNYAAAGFEVFERGVLTATVNTSWAKRLEGRRVITYLIARAS